MEDQPDSISWRWTENGQYTANSAYKIQFQGTLTKRDMSAVWKAKAQPKCKTFAWIMLQHKILTADNLAKRGWTHDQSCHLCDQEHETSTHLCKDCVFTREVWHHLSGWLHISNLPPFERFRSPYGWWRAALRKIDKLLRYQFSGLVLVFWWNIWKERNARVFRATSKTAFEVAGSIKEDVVRFSIALSRL